MRKIFKRLLSLCHRIALGFSVISLLITIAIIALQPEPPPLKTVRHSDGLVVRVSEEVIVEERDSSLYIRMPKEAPGSRESTSLEIELHEGEQLPAEAKPARTYLVKNRVIRYTYEEDGGGSGGSVYLIKAWEEISGGYIFYDYYEQPGELSDPNYRLCWQAIEGTTLHPVNRSAN